MSIIKKYDVGEINVTLPTCNYIHRLPLISFGDIHGGFTLSLCFNYVMKNEGTNTFGIAAGFKLNVDKRIIFENGAPAKFRDENGDLILLNGSDGLYGFEDNSGRILRGTYNGYNIEYPDFSKEHYATDGKIERVYDKCGNCMIEFGWDAADHIKTIIYIGGQNTGVYYGTDNRITRVSYGGKTVSFTYTSDGVRATDSNGVAFLMSSSGWNYSCTASSTEGEDNISYVTKIERVASSSSLKCSYIDRGTVTDTVTYEFCNGLYAGRSSARIIVTDKKGARTVLYYNADKRLLYSHEDAADAGFMDGKFTGTVDIFGTLDSEEDVKMLCAYPNDSDINVYLEDATNQRWKADVSQMYLNVKGYYLLTGWIKFKDGMQQPGYNKLNISDSATVKCSFTPLYTATGGWSFFAYRFYFGANFITVFPEYRTAVELRDVRLTFKPDRILADNKSDYLALSENVLIYHYNGANDVMPFGELQFSFTIPVGGTAPGEVHYADFVRYVLNKKKNPTSSSYEEVYTDNCRRVNKVSVGSFLVSWNGIPKAPNCCYPGQRRYTPSGVVTTVFKDDVENEFLVCETLDPNGNIIASATYDRNLNMTKRTVDGVATRYQYNSEGLMTLENGGYYSIAKSYSVDANDRQLVDITDEFNANTRYTYDSIWGALVREDDSDGSIAYVRDSDGCTVTRKNYSVTGRSINYAYSAGNLVHADSGGLVYAFGYGKGYIGAVWKNNTVFEQHEKTDTQEDSYYPKKAEPVYSELATYDKYDRLTLIDGAVENTYDVNPSLLSTGAYSVSGQDNASGKLATSRDIKSGDTVKYAYQDGKLKSAASFGSSGTKGAEETFSYDGSGRLCSDKYTSTVERIEQRFEYVKPTGSFNEDTRVSNYSLLIDGLEKAYISNTYDFYKRLSHKETLFNRLSVIRNFTYDNSKLTKIEQNCTGDGAHIYELGTDGQRRITSWRDSVKGYTVRYVYDSHGQLIRENNGQSGNTYVYEYDGIGNITKMSKYPLTDSTITGNPQSKDVYTYSTTSPDVLVSFNNKNIAYDNAGCITSFDGRAYTWTNGRLGTVSWAERLDSTGKKTYFAKKNTITYNGRGQRTRVKYTYTPGLIHEIDYLRSRITNYSYDMRGRLVGESRTSIFSDGDKVERELTYLYEGDEIIGLRYTVNNQTGLFFYDKNPFGDVIAILDQNGNAVAEYEYDAYGNCLEESGPNTDLAESNPIRYRSYYYDEDTGLYYLNARYYNPKLRRFISPDNSAYLDTGSPQGLNLYAYCGNDPVSHSDPDGHLPEWANWLIGAAIIVTTAALTVITAGGFAAAGVAVASVFTAAMAPTALSAVFAGAFVGATLAGAVGLLACGASGDDWSWEEASQGFLGGTVIGAFVGGAWGGAHYALQKAGIMAVKTNINNVVVSPKDDFFSVGAKDHGILNHRNYISRYGRYDEIYARRLGNSMFEIANGHHRYMALKQLGYKAIKFYLTK